MIRYLTHHVNQGVFEYWEFHTIFGWKNIPKEIAHEWSPSTYEYNDVRHDMQPDKDGLYGVCQEGEAS